MASPVQPLDFERIISYAIGDATLFVYLFLIAMSIYAAKMRMPTEVYLMLMFLFIVIMYLTIGWGPAIVVFVIMGLFLGYKIVRIFQ